MKTDRLFYGCDYNPEQWPDEVWHEDILLMKSAGVNLVSLAIFSWARLEPKPGVYDFDWLDRVVGLLGEAGIGINLATATASPPPWFSKRHPSSLPMTKDGKTLGTGSRQHYHPSSKAFRQSALALCHEMARRYARNPAIVMWHINNEYSCHVPESYDEESVDAFRLWLSMKYASIEALNEAWGTTFWGQQYGDWDEIDAPRLTPTFSNPCQLLDFRRFSSNAFIELCHSEIEAVRHYNPDLPVTTNLLGIHPAIDQFEIAQHLDIIAWDSYPDPRLKEASAPGIAENHDMMRSLGRGRPFMLMEQVTSQVNWREINALKPPGMMRAQSWQAVARGADAVMFFQWRASRIGAEKFHGAMVPHIGTDSRIWREIKGLGAELAASAEISGTTFRSKVGILHSWDNWWAVETPTKPRILDYRQIQSAFHKCFYDQNIPVDFVHPSSRLDSYQVLVAPLLYLITAEQAENLRQFVAQGGSLVMTWFSGIVDGSEHVQLGGYPAYLRDVLGLKVEEWEPLDKGFENRIVSSWLDKPATCDYWADVLKSEGAEILGTFEANFFAGCPAFTKNIFGKGQAYYLASCFDDSSLRQILSRICFERGIQPMVSTPSGVEASVRSGNRASYLFLINHTEKEQLVDLGALSGRDLLKEVHWETYCRLDAYGVAILKLEDKVAN